MYFFKNLEYRIFGYKKKSHLLFLPENSFLFEITNIAKKIIEGLRENRAIDKLYCKYGRYSVQEVFRELGYLKERGYFGNPAEKNIFTRVSRVNGIKGLELILTSSCNMACSYCFANKGKFDFGKNIGDMDWITARKSIDWFLRINRGSIKPIYILFFGGEPLLNVDILEKCMAYSHDVVSKGEYPPLRFVLTTNGTLLNRKIIELLKKYKCVSRISIDPSERSHNERRKYSNGKNSYKDIVKRLRMIKKIAPSLPIVFYPTFCLGDSLEDIILLQKQFESSQLNIRLESSMFETYRKKKKDFYLFIERLREELEGLSKLKNSCFKILPDYLFHSLLFNVPSFLGCGAGLERVAISPKGGIYTCSFGMEKLGAIGDISRGIKKVHAEKIRKKYERLSRNSKDCVSCWARRLCKGLCLLSNSRSSIVYGKNTGCDLIRLLTEFYIKNYAPLSFEDFKDVFSAQIIDQDFLSEALHKAKILYEIKELKNEKLKHVKHITPNMI